MYFILSKVDYIDWCRQVTVKPCILQLSVIYIQFIKFTKSSTQGLLNVDTHTKTRDPRTPSRFVFHEVCSTSGSTAPLDVHFFLSLLRHFMRALDNILLRVNSLCITWDLLSLFFLQNKLGSDI